MNWTDSVSFWGRILGMPGRRQRRIERGRLGLMDSTYEQLAERNSELEADKARLLDEIERLRIEAQVHAQEARTQRATVHEIYRVVTDGKGEPGNWNGVRPVREAFERLRNDNTELRRQLTSMRCP